MFRYTVIVFLALIFGSQLAFSQANVQRRKQGFSMILNMDNRGSFGRVAYPGVIGGTDPGPDSIGLEYPVGQPFEHLFGAGIWIGGLLDTSTGPVPRVIRGVSTAYEGWSGPYFEFFPGPSPADTIFRIFKRADGTYPPKPLAWDDPNGLEGAIPYKPISDADYYMKYDDRHVRVQNHVPLNLKVFQSSYAWNDRYADAIIILRYRIVNVGTKPIDSAFVGFFFEADVGPIHVANYWQRNFTGYYPDARTAYVHNPSDLGSTPVGCALLETSQKRLDSLTYSFRWWPGTSHPGTDADRYARLSSGIIDSNQSISNLSDTRFLFGFGPFSIRPNPQPDTLSLAVAFISGFDPRGNHLAAMHDNATRALDIYINQGIRLPATPPSPPLRVEVGDRKVRLNWRWTPADSVGPQGRPNPVANWDRTSNYAHNHPTWYLPEYPEYTSRTSPPYPPGVVAGDSGGRNFESYRLWRSEHPDYPDYTFTLVKQWDVQGDSIDFDTGLEFEYVDSNLVRGKRYVYSVTSRSIPNLVPLQIIVHDTVQNVLVPTGALESQFRTNAVVIDLPFATSDQLGKVRVVPNPYRTDKDYTVESGGYEGLTFKWDESKRIIKFINLPVRCTIRVFSLAGDLVRTIQHDGGGGAFPRGDHDMPLVSESNRALASGVYIFSVESDLGTQVGKFVIIR